MQRFPSRRAVSDHRPTRPLALDALLTGVRLPAGIPSRPCSGRLRLPSARDPAATVLTHGRVALPRSYPGFASQPRDSTEVLGVVGDENSLPRDCVSGDHRIESTNGGSPRGEVGGKTTEVPSGV